LCGGAPLILAVRLLLTKLAHVPDNAFHGLIAEFADEMIILGDIGFHAKDGDPPNLKVCKRGRWNVRMVVETVLWLYASRHASNLQ